MAWTEITRAKYERQSGRYASNVTDQEWDLIASVPITVANGPLPPLATRVNAAVQFHQTGSCITQHFHVPDGGRART